MKFALLVAIVPEELEQRTIELSKAAGAGGMTILTGKGLASDKRRTFFGMTFEGNLSVLLVALERRMSLKVLKSVQSVLDQKEPHEHSKGIVFTLPIEHIGGLDLQQLSQFEQLIRDEI